MLNSQIKAGGKKEFTGGGGQAPSPAISLPKGGGAISGIGEKFQASPVTGTGSLSVPIAISPGRSGFSPQLSLSYDSGSGNSPFGLGWNISLPSISRKTAKGIPEYRDEIESDTFLLSGAEDLVPALIEKHGKWEKVIIEQNSHTIYRYRPRIEGLFARIERWVNNETGFSHWRAVTKDNVTTIYGESPEARIADPEDGKRIFQWLIEKSYDDKGNIIVYEYKKEDLENVKSSLLYEKNRLNSKQPLTNKYLKHVKYGNTLPYKEQDNFFQENKWLFQLVFDYGEHDKANPTVEEQQLWPLRSDPFSECRAGFEIRTYRLCRRVLMFHNFEELGPQPCLVRSTDLIHDENPVASLVTSIIHSGYQKADNTAEYIKKSMPPLEFKYTEAEIDEIVYRIEDEYLENVPNGVDGRQYRWFDLKGEGLSGILTEQGEAWYYKTNQGNARFGASELVAAIPSVSNLGNGQQQLMDLGGEGEQNLVVLSDSLKGFYELDETGHWEDFISFRDIPNINWNDPNLRMIDLNGDGHADILITEDNCFTWYPSKAKEGYKEAEFVSKAIDEEKGPALVFADAAQSVYLSDMSGDGLNDIVRIRNGEVCYWPSLGYGRFGAKVTMADAPVFDYPDYFQQSRIRLADIDGTGTTDIMYLDRDKIKYWHNQSGNSWSETRELTNFPQTDNLSSVNVIDLLGNGTACLVWSSPLPAESHEDMRYIKLMSDRKPYLLSETKNNMGAVTRSKYASSTKFYLQDRQNGNPWITKLPFPVHVLERTETYDEVTDTRFVTLYAFHHGYFDGYEREFRGFGMVEQWDTETYDSFKEDGLFPVSSNALDETSHVPPVYTKTWFHTGFYQRRGKISKQYEKEYYKGDPDAWLLRDTVLPPGLTAEEQREACRSLKGQMLRQEVYALDNKSESRHPYTVSENKYYIEHKQPRADNRHGVFFVSGSEALSYHYERDPADPRISHQMTLEIDEYGNPTKSAAIVYPRRNPEYDEQKPLLITYNEADFINIDDSTDLYRIGVPYETRSYEITGIQQTGSEILQKPDLKNDILGATGIPFEDKPVTNQIQKRLIGHSRNTFYSKDLNTELPLGQIAFHALPYKSYQMAFTPELINQIYNDGVIRVTDSMLENEGKYVLEDGAWWSLSGRMVFDDARFYLPVQSIDPFENISTVEYDDYNLLLKQTTDPLSNTISSKNDYCFLQPDEVTGPNGNRSAVAFDTLGMVVETAIMGKEGEIDPAKMGDTLDEPTTRLEYELFNWMNNKKPNFVHTFAREKHGAANPRWQESYSYSGGLGQGIMTKIQAEPGPAFAREQDGTLKRDGNDELLKEHTDHRWVGNGRTIFNNKGKPVKQYEPYFSSTYEFEDEDELREYGVTPIIHYDPLTRVIRTDLPDGTFSKVEFTAWNQESWDQNDTVLESDWYIERGSPDPNMPNESTDSEERAAYLAAKHSNTPQIIHLDTLGRTFLTIDDNGALGEYETRIELDIKGNILSVTDAKDRVIARTTYNLLDQGIYTESVDARNRWLLNNVAGNPLRAWDERDHEFMREYDKLQRPTSAWVKNGSDTPLLVNYTVYGEKYSNAADFNLRGQIYEQFDQSGVVINDEFNFKGNPLNSTRQIAKDYKTTIDWSVLNGLSNIQDIANAAASLLEPESFTSSTEYDALNRPVKLTTPDNSNIRPSYNEANFLEKVEVQLRGATEWTPFVNNINYDEKGQRVLIEYGNNVKTEYRYDDETFRLQNLKTTRDSGNNPLQNLSYAYDPVGNITSIRDEALQTIYFNNEVVSPGTKYTYDALYRLIEAKGREHIGQSGNNLPEHKPEHKPHYDFNDSTRKNLTHPNEANAMRNYTEEYQYDDVGNILKMIHSANGNGSWTRRYRYAEDSNRLLATNLPSDGDEDDDPFSAEYKYDTHGNMIKMPHLPVMEWDFEDQLHMVDKNGGGKAWYVYDAAGKRVRKVVEKNNGSLIEERIYLGGFEIFRKRINGNVTLERETLHIVDDTQRIALVETKTIDTNNDPSPTQLIRYQFSNHLGSASLELDNDGKIISYEEYYPYGSTSYQAVDKSIKVAAKRYRYTGKERDEETGLYYHGARYYACWLGRWTSCDPIGIVDGTNLYKYARNSPLVFNDPTGNQGEPHSSLNTKIKDVEARIGYIDNVVKSNQYELNNLQNEALENDKEIRGRMEMLDREIPYNKDRKTITEQISNSQKRNNEIAKTMRKLSGEVKTLNYERGRLLDKLSHLQAQVAEKEREETIAFSALGVGGGRPTFTSKAEKKAFIYKVPNRTWTSLSATNQEIVANALYLRQGGGGAPPSSLPREPEVSFGVSVGATVVGPPGGGRIGLNLQLGGGNSGLYFVYAVGPEEFTGLDMGVSGGLNFAHGRGKWSGPFNTAGGNISIYGIDYFESPGGGFNGVEGWEGFGPSISLGLPVGVTAGRETYVPIIGGR